MKRFDRFLKYGVYFAWTVGLIGACEDLGGCSSVRQQTVAPKVVVAQPARIRVPGGELIDPATRERYNALISVYGKAHLSDGAPVFVPALAKDDGLTQTKPDQWFITNAALQNFAELSDLKEQGFPTK